MVVSLSWIASDSGRAAACLPTTVSTGVSIRSGCVSSGKYEGQVRDGGELCSGAVVVPRFAPVEGPELAHRVVVAEGYG